MGYLKTPISNFEFSKLSAAKMKATYEDIIPYYNKLLDREFVYCHKCNEFLSKDRFYSSKSYQSGYFPICKKCLLAMVEQRDEKRTEPNETKESVQTVLQMMDLPYIDTLYNSCYKLVQDDVNKTSKKSPFLAYLVPIQSLPQFKNLTWKDSEFPLEGADLKDVTKKKQRMIDEGRKRFGTGFTAEAYLYLEQEYEDWTSRYPCENKAQELLFRRLCFKQWDAEKAQRTGKETKEIDKSIQEIMTALNIKPSQSNTNALTEAKTFGQLIQQWEQTQPIPEPDEEFKDVDKIGLYIDVFFKGHLSKMMGLKNAFSSLYEKFISKYTVTKPEYDEEVDSEVLFEKIFGSKMEEE